MSDKIKVEPLTETDKELSVIIKNAQPMPEGFDTSNPPPSGFVDEPEVYEEVVLGETRAERKLAEKHKKQMREVAERNILDEPDAMEWALHFIEIRKARLAIDGTDIAQDAGAMVVWFANAFQRGEWNSPLYKSWAKEYIESLEGTNAVLTTKKDW